MPWIAAEHLAEFHCSIAYTDESAQRLFLELPEAVRTQVLQPLMAECAKILADAMRSEAPRDSGLLRKAIGASAVKKYPTVLFVTAEVRGGFRRAVTKTRRGGLRVRSKAFSAAQGEDANFRNPRKYLHLVVGGRKAVSVQSAEVLYSAYTGKFFGQSVKKADPNPFVDRAFAEAQGRVFAYMNAEAPARIEAEAERIGK